MSKPLNEVVVAAYGRCAVGKAYKGSLKATHPVEYAGLALAGVLEKLPALPAGQIEDVVVGCSIPEGTTGSNVARLIAQRAGLPDSVPGQTVNRFCSSGLQSIATASNAIMAGQAQVMVAGGVESMSTNNMGTDNVVQSPWMEEHIPDMYMSMGITAENVAERYNISRPEMEAFAVRSHQKAAAAQSAGRFEQQIIPLEVKNDEGERVVFKQDEGIRPNASPESLAQLKPAFKPDGLVTAGISSQMSDGAAFVVLMARQKADELGIKPVAVFRGFAVTGLEPAYMGLGPITAVPKVMELTGLSLAMMDVIELNEAFASQALACIRDLGMNPDKVNPNGGALAMGHPLGATGSILTCKALAELQRTGGRYGLVTMCIGGGMGAAGVYEMC